MCQPVFSGFRRELHAVTRIVGTGFPRHLTGMRKSLKRGPRLPIHVRRVRRFSDDEFDISEYCYGPGDEDGK